MKLQMHFGTMLDSTTKKGIMCWLCKSASYPCYNVMTYDSIYCDSLSSTNFSYNSTSVHQEFRMLQETTSSPSSSDGSTDVPSTDSPKPTLPIK